MTTISDNLACVQARIQGACKRAGRSPEVVRLVAVSKNHPPDAISTAWAAGQRLYGENRVQEARSKIPESPGGAEWHLIGHLQKNKIRQALPLFALIHSVDSIELAAQIQRIAEEDGHHPAILLEVNIAGESSKFGVAPNELPAALEAMLAMPRLEICGLMGMAPFAPDPESARPYFARLRELRDRMQEKLACGLPELSMGMSGDYEVAVEEGSTLVRVGTAIFGGR